MMKLLMFFLMTLLSLMLLTACNTTPQNQESMEEDTGLSSQYTNKSNLRSKTAADINTELGAGYISNGNYERALVKLKKALRQNPNHALAYNYLGVLYGRLERPKLAYQAFNQSMRLAPNDSTILNNYAVFLCEQGKYVEAQEKFNKVINNPLYPNRDVAYQTAGWCALDNEDYKLAEKLYRKALNLNDNMPRSQLGLARIYYEQESYNYAWSFFKRFDDAAVQDADSLWLGINILRKMDKPDYNLLSSYELQLKNKFANSDQARWYYENKQEY
jgi:type IV pilus assembly protein PilF